MLQLNMEKETVQTEKKNTKIEWRKQRGMRRCLLDGWRMVACGWKGYMRSLWATALAKALCAAFLLELFVQYISHFAQPAFRIWQTSPDSPLVGLLLYPDWSTALYMLIASIFMIACVYLLKGKLYEVIHGYACREGFGKRPRWGISPLALQSAYKSFKMDVLLYIPAIALLIICSLLLKSHWAACLSLCGLILVALWSVAGVARPLYAFYGLSLAASLKTTFRKEWHRTWPLRFVEEIFILAVGFVCWLSPITYILTVSAGTDSVLMGDPAGIPSYVPLLFFLTNALGFFVLFMFTTVAQWPVVLMLRKYEEAPQSSVVVDANQG